MFGASIAAPLATPTILAGPASTSTIFLYVSVVNIESANDSAFASRPPTSSGIDPAIFWAGRGIPIGPVEATNTSSGAQPIGEATAAADALTAASPSEPVHAFASP